MTMKHLFGLKTLLILLLSIHLKAQKFSFSKSEIVSDLSLLKTKLEQNHATLYTYSTKDQINDWFNYQIKNLPDSMSHLETYKLISSISSLIKDGHSYIYPSQQHLNEFFNSAPLFPIDVFLTGDSLVVLKNYSYEQNIPIGAIITNINGLSTNDIRLLITKHTSRDGDNLEYPQHLFYKFFAANYSYFFGFPKNFKIEFIDNVGKNKEVVVEGLNRDAIKLERKAEQEKGISLHFLENSTSTAILTVKSFSNKNLKEEYRQKFKPEIKKAFKNLKQQNIENLAIDIRDNQGGEISNGIYLLKFFMNSTFKCVDSYYSLRGQKMKKLNSIWDNPIKPRGKNHFKGKVFVLINGGSYSCSSIVANTFKESKRGLTLGQMTGGSAYVNSGAPNLFLTLPNSKVLVTIPKTRYLLRENLNSIGLGVIPDIYIQDKPERMTGGSDNYNVMLKNIIHPK